MRSAEPKAKGQAAACAGSPLKASTGACLEGSGIGAMASVPFGNPSRRAGLDRCQRRGRTQPVACRHQAQALRSGSARGLSPGRRVRPIPS